MPFLLSRATRADVPALVDLHYKVIQGPISDVLIGFDTEDGRKAAVKRWQQEMEQDPASLWLQVADSDTGRVVSAAHWKIYPSSAPIHVAPAKLDYLKEEDRHLAEEIINKLTASRVEHQHGSPHVLLYRLYTDTEFQKLGCGSMLVKYGCDVADRLFVPAWVESSPVGEHLYRSHGFKDFMRVELKNHKYDLSGPMLRREPREPAQFEARN